MIRKEPWLQRAASDRDLQESMKMLFGSHGDLSIWITFWRLSERMGVSWYELAKGKILSADWPSISSQGRWAALTEGMAPIAKGEMLLPELIPGRVRRPALRWDTNLQEFMALLESYTYTIQRVSPTISSSGLLAYSDTFPPSDYVVGRDRPAKVNLFMDSLDEGDWDQVNIIRKYIYPIGDESVMQAIVSDYSVVV